MDGGHLTATTTARWTPTESLPYPHTLPYTGRAYRSPSLLHARLRWRTQHRDCPPPPPRCCRRAGVASRNVAHPRWRHPGARRRTLQTLPRHAWHHTHRPRSWRQAPRAAKRQSQRPHGGRQPPSPMTCHQLRRLIVPAQSCLRSLALRPLRLRCCAARRDWTAMWMTRKGWMEQKLMGRPRRTFRS